MPLTSRTFDQLINFTRTSAATFVGSNGLIQTTPQSVNIFTYTQEFDNFAWNKTSVTVAANSTVAPDGTSTADTITAVAAASTHVIFLSQSLAGATQWTASVYAKAGTHGFLQMFHGSNSDFFANFNLTTGVVGTKGPGVPTSTITPVGDGWYRCSMTFTPGTASAIRIAMVSSASAIFAESWTPAGTETFFLWGAQAEIAAAPTTYTRNFGGLFPPRFDYNPVTLAPRGLLVEEQRTNLMLYSEQFDNGYWAVGGSTISANATTAPDGTSTADKLVEDTSTGNHRVLNNTGVTVVSGATYAWTVYAKAAERTVVQLLNNNLQGAVFDLTNGGVSGITAGFSASATAFGNGWYRLSIVGPASSTTERLLVYLQSGGTNSYTGNGTSGAFIWGAQLEAGAFATSYIRTVASQVTRTADIATIAAPNFAPWYSQSQGTFVVETVTIKPTTVSTSGTAIDASDGGISNRNRITFDTASVSAITTVGGVTQSAISQNYTANAVEKLAYAFAANDFAFARNGGLVGTDTSGALPTVNQMFIGNAAGSASFLNGYMRRVTFYPTRLTNAQLQALTT